MNAIRKSLLLLILIPFFKGCKEMEKKDYKIMDIDDLLILIKEKNFQPPQQDSTTLYLIYKNIDGQVVLMPPLGNKGLLVDNESAYHKLMENLDDFPLKDEHPGPFLLEQDRLKSKGHGIDYYMEKLSRELQIEINVFNNDSSYLKQIDKKIQNYGYIKAYNNLFIPIGVFIGEKLKKEKKANWVLLKRFGYTPYYELMLESESKEFFPWYKLYDNLIVRKKFQIQEYYEKIEKGFSTNKKR